MGFCSNLVQWIFCTTMPQILSRYASIQREMKNRSWQSGRENTWQPRRRGGQRLCYYQKLWWENHHGHGNQDALAMDLWARLRITAEMGLPWEIHRFLMIWHTCIGWFSCWQRLQINGKTCRKGPLKTRRSNWNPGNMIRKPEQKLRLSRAWPWTICQGHAKFLYRLFGYSRGYLWLP